MALMRLTFEISLKINNLCIIISEIRAYFAKQFNINAEIKNSAPTDCLIKSQLE